jgi:hypothetical protein
VTRPLSAVVLLVVALAGCDDAPPATDPQAVPEEPPADELEARLRARGREAADWMTRSGSAYRGEVAEGDARDFSHIMQPGFCYKVVGLAEGIEDLDISVYDENNVLLQRDTTEDAQPVIGSERPLCPYDAATYRLQVRARRGAGRFAVQFYRSL